MSSRSIGPVRGDLTYIAMGGQFVSKEIPPNLAPPWCESGSAWEVLSSPFSVMPTNRLRDTLRLERRLMSCGSINLLEPL